MKDKYQFKWFEMRNNKGLEIRISTLVLMLSSLYSKKLEEMTLIMDERKEHKFYNFKLRSNDFKEKHMTSQPPD